MKFKRFPGASRDARRVFTAPALEGKVREFQKAKHAVIIGVLDVTADSPAFVAIQARVQIDQ